MKQPLYFTKITENGPAEWKPFTASTLGLIAEAEAHGVRWKEIPGTLILELQWQDQIRHIYTQVPDTTSYIAFYATEDKEVAKNMLRAAGVSVAQGFSVRRAEGTERVAAIFEKLQKPLVVKPTHGEKGSSVFLNITDLPSCTTAVLECLNYAKSDSEGALIEEQFVGEEFRVLATQHKLIAIMKRVPANVVGDGQKTIRELVEIKNANPQRTADRNTGCVKISLGEVEIATLKDQQLTLESVPSAEQKVFLRYNSNLSTGGDGIDFTDKAHEDVKKIALQVMNAIPGLSVAGIDFMTKDITQPQTAETYQIVEVNKSPGFIIHDNPFEGRVRHASREYLYLLFPELEKRV